MWIQTHKQKKLSAKPLKASLFVARPARFEHATPWFVVKYSIQLSYGRPNNQAYIAALITEFKKFLSFFIDPGIRISWEYSRSIDFSGKDLWNSIPSNGPTPAGVLFVPAALRDVFRRVGQYSSADGWCFLCGQGRTEQNSSAILPQAFINVCK